MSCIVESSDGLVWIGTNRGGINCFNPSDESVRNYKITTPGGEQESEFNDIKALWPTPDGRQVYIGAFGSGLNVLERSSGRIRHVGGSRDVYSIQPATEDRLWIGASPGIFTFDRKTERLEQRHRMRVRTLKVVGDSLLWAANDGEIRLFAIDDKSGLHDVTPQPVLMLKGARDIHPDGTSYWISSDAGVFVYDSEDNSISEITDSESKALLDANGIEIDGYGYVWISTKHGLYRYDPSGGHTMHYSRRNGLLSNTLLEYSHCTLSDGRMMFGGIGGLNIVDPSEFLSVYRCPEACITGLILHGKEVRPGDGSGILVNSIEETAGIRLRHDQDQVTLRFSAPDFIGAKSARFEYRMEGLDKAPRLTGAEPIAIYSYLPPGSYTFRVAAITSEGERSTQDCSLSVEVLPPWYLSTIAIVMFVLAGILMVISVVWAILRHQKMAAELKMQQMERQFQRELVRAKTRQYLASGGASNPVESDEEHFLYDTINAVESHIDDPDMNVDTLAKIMGISKTTLQSRIRKLTGASALEFIHKVKFSEACRLLKEESLTVKEVCFRLGFSSPSYFVASFKKYTGMTPKAFVKKE